MSMRLEDIELIKRVKYLYCRSLDTCDSGLVASLLTEDATIDYEGGTYHFKAEGREAIVEALRQAFHAQMVGCHTVHHPVIDVHDDDTADGHWTLVDYALNLVDRKATVGSSFYVDTYVKTDGVWRIKTATYKRVYERVYVEPEVGLTAHMLADRHRQGLAGL